MFKFFVEKRIGMSTVAARSLSNFKNSNLCIQGNDGYYEAATSQQGILSILHKFYMFVCAYNSL